MTLLTGRSPAPVSGTPRPLRAVLDALGKGAASVADISVATGLPRDVVTDAIDHLVRLGRLAVETLPGGCPSGGCGGCPIGRRADGCAAAAPSRAPSANRPGPVLVTISVR